MSLKVNRNIVALFSMQYSLCQKADSHVTRNKPSTPTELIARMRRQVASLDRAVMNGIDLLKIAQP